jgi:type I restriction enzyme S subunit
MSRFKHSEIGLIPENWSIKEFSELLTEKTRNGLYKPKNFHGKGTKMINMGELFAYDKIDDSEMDLVELTDSEKERFLVKNGDLLFARRSLVAAGACKCSLVVGNVERAFESSLIRARPDPEKASSQYIFYFFASTGGKHLLDSIRRHVAVAGITGSDLMNLKIPLPSLRDQHSVARFLSVLDAKITLNQRMNRTLEVIGRAIFNRWFVDFEFPNEEGKPYKSSGGEMVHSEELEKDIPKGWTAEKLGVFIDLDRGLSYKGAFLSDHGLPMINLGTIAPKAGFISEGIKHYTGEYKEKQLVKAGDIVIANTDITQKREVLGSPAIVPPNLGCERALFTHHIFAVRRKTSLPNLFIYYLLQLQGYRERVIGFATGTTVLALPKDAVLDFKFAVPDGRILHTFEKTVDLLMGKTNGDTEQNKNLVQIRDTLLPKLMSGRIRVPPENRKRYDVQSND